MTKEKNQEIQESKEDREATAEQAKATQKLKDMLERLDMQVDYAEADWKDTETLVTESYKIMVKHPDWHLHYIAGDEFGIDANYVFLTSKPAYHGTVREIARLIIDEGAELEGEVVRLPSGQEVMYSTLSEIADFLAIDMLQFEQSYNDACATVAEELMEGYEGEYETLPSIGPGDREHLLEAIRVPTLEYLEKLRLARSRLFDEMLKNRRWW
jgi:hypothetical protein